MKSFRLIVHQKAFSEEDILISPKDYPEAKEGDIVEIYHPQPEEENPRLLLQIKAFKDDLQTKDTISVEQSIAAAFGLRTYKDVIMKIVPPADVALDSVELTFKDQYMGRSEMWRLKRSLTNTCVYMNKKLEFCGGAVRCQVYEMWSQGDRVACGVITDDTKVVFRSSTSMVYLFLQMSSEMWDFDIHGDLYFEKAVNGFLADLFQKWKKNGSNHEVTIVLFSRTFYQANSLEEFPEHMRECLQQDYRGRYYEDFYRPLNEPLRKELCYLQAVMSKMSKERFYAQRNDGHVYGYYIHTIHNVKAYIEAYLDVHDWEFNPSKQALDILLTAYPPQHDVAPFVVNFCKRRNSHDICPIPSKIMILK